MSANKIQAKNTIANDSDFLILSISFCSAFLIEKRKLEIRAISPAEI